MNKVYLVEQGEYSYYHIVEIFTSKELAEQFCAKMNEDSKATGDYLYTFREVNLTDTLPVIKKRLSVFADFDEDGNVIGEVTEHFRSYYPDQYEYTREECDFFLHERSYKKPITYGISISDYNYERARKVFTEQQARLKADIDNGVRPQPRV